MAPERIAEIEPDGSELTLGRRAGVAVELPFPAVSAVHARLRRCEEGWAIIDLGSANGTFVEGKRLLPGVPRVWQPGESARLADVTLVLESAAVDGPPLSGAEGTATLARRLVSDLFGAASPAEVTRIVVESGAQNGQSLSLRATGRRYLVGRAAHCDLILVDPDVSREHAALERTWEGVLVRNLGAKNGVEVLVARPPDGPGTGERVTGTRRLREGDILLIGATRLRVEDPEDRYLRRMEAQEDDRRLAPEQAPSEEPRREVPSAASVSGTPSGPPAEVAVAKQPEVPAEPRPSASRAMAPRAVGALAILVLVGVALLGVWLLLTPSQ